jgi:uncharacterized protein
MKQRAPKIAESMGLDFKDAVTAFDDPFHLLADDPAHSTRDEVREWLIGEANAGILIVVFTIRPPGNICRIISARRANRRERRVYEKNKGVSI